MAASLARLNASSGVNYYAKDNYYSHESGIEKSSWYGKGATYFNLEGRVNPTQFQNLMDGKDPSGMFYLGGIKPRERVNPETGKVEKHRAGIDITFAPPKSVSLAALLDDRKDIERAHKRAVEKTLSEIEQKYSVCRVGPRGRQINEICGNLVVARFEHDTSRSRDPQLHTHCVIISAVRRPDHSWRRIHNDVFWNNSKDINQKYLFYLKEELKKENIPVVEKGTCFEIAGYDNVILAQFSKQSQKIEQMKTTDKYQNILKHEVGQGRTEHKVQKYVERTLKLLERDKKSVELDRENLKNVWNEERKNVLSIDGNRFIKDIGLAALSFGIDFFTKNLEKSFSFAIKAISEISLGSIFHDQPLSRESYEYFGSLGGRFVFGALGSFLCGPLGSLVIGSVGGSIGQQIVSNVIEMSTGETSFQNYEKDSFMRKEKKEQILEQEKTKNYDNDFKFERKNDEMKQQKENIKEQKEIDLSQNKKELENEKRKNDIFSKEEKLEKQKESESSKEKKIDFDEWER